MAEKSRHQKYVSRVISHMKGVIERNNNAEQKINIDDDSSNEVIQMATIYVLDLATKKFKIIGHKCPFCNKVMSKDRVIEQHAKKCKKINKYLEESNASQSSEE